MSSSMPANCAEGSDSTPSRSAARATARASMRSDLPRSRPARRASLISLVATRTTRSPLAIRNRSNEPETCRQSSSAHTRCSSTLRAQSSSARNPTSPTRTLCSPSTSPVVAPIAATVCDCLCMSAPSTIIPASSCSPQLTVGPLGGHGLLEGAPTLLSSHAEPSRTGNEQHCERKSGHPADSLKQRVSSPPARDHLLHAGRRRRDESEQQALTAAAGLPFSWPALNAERSYRRCSEP